MRLNRGVLTTSTFRLSHVWTSGSPQESSTASQILRGILRANGSANLHHAGGGPLNRCSCGRQPVLRPATVRCGDGRLILCCPLRVERSSAKNSRLRAERCRPVTGQKVMLRPHVEIDSCQLEFAPRGDVAPAQGQIRLVPRARTLNHSQPGVRSRRLQGRTAACPPASKRLVYAQQNAYRCDPSGGDPGGCAARPTRGGIRLRIREP